MPDVWSVGLGAIGKGSLDRVERSRSGSEAELGGIECEVFAFPVGSGEKLSQYGIVFGDETHWTGLAESLRLQSGIAGDVRGHA